MIDETLDYMRENWDVLEKEIIDFSEKYIEAQTMRVKFVSATTPEDFLLSNEVSTNYMKFLCKHCKKEFYNVRETKTHIIKAIKFRDYIKIVEEKCSISDVRMFLKNTVIVKKTMHILTTKATTIRDFLNNELSEGLISDEILHYHCSHCDEEFENIKNHIIETLAHA